MRIEKYKCQARGSENWNFSEVEFQQLNLLVGDTATGKTRFLNTIFNVGTFVASDEYKNGYWDITFSQRGSTYHWALETDGLQNGEDSRILRESLELLEGDQQVSLIERTPDVFSFRGERLPKLSPRVSAISLLKEEESVQDVYEGFATICRRRFFHDALTKVSQLEAISPGLLSQFKRKASGKDLYKSKLGLNATLYVLSRNFKSVYSAIRDKFREAFPFVAEADVRDLSQVAPHLAFPTEIPVFCIRERTLKQWIPITEISSGMQKVLLILTDMFTLPDGAIYIIDEYENSLGINAIDFFPNFVLTLEKEIQFFVTSHHPYIINEIPPRNWYIFHRKGTQVSVKYGEELQTRFGKSKQQAFVQLINDPFYIEGIE